MHHKWKIAFLISHPTQYHSPLFRELAKHPQIDLTVYFCSKIGLGEQYDKTYGRVLRWDTPVLEGYDYVFLKNPFQIFGVLKKNKYDVLIIHGYNLLAHWLTFLGAWLTKTPLILKGEADNEKKPTFPKNIIKKIILNSLFKKASAFLYSYDLNKEFFKFYGAPEEKLFFCPSAVDNDFFRTEREELNNKRTLKNELGIMNDEPVLLYVGQFIQRKRLKDILEAAEILKDKTSFNILFVGEGKEKENLLKFVRENNLENVYFLGFKNQSELPKIYAAVDIFILPSQYDPSPKAMQEALNFELPIIASDGVKTAADIILKGECGFVYPVGDIKKLAEKIKKILENDALRFALGKRALATVSEWSYEKDVQGILDALKFLSSKS